MTDLTSTNLKENLERYQLDGIECEVRGVQHFMGPAAASSYWYRAFAHKHPDYVYSPEQEKIVRKDATP